MKNQVVSKLITSDEFRSNPAFHKMWNAPANNGIQWVPGTKQYYLVREVNGKQYFIFEDCIVLAWRFCRLYTIPLELEERMRSIAAWESNFMAIALATKSSDPLKVAIQKLCAENKAHNDALLKG